MSWTLHSRPLPNGGRSKWICDCCVDVRSDNPARSIDCDKSSRVFRDVARGVRPTLPHNEGALHFCARAECLEFAQQVEGRLVHEALME